MRNVSKIRCVIFIFIAGNIFIFTFIFIAGNMEVPDIGDLRRSQLHRISSVTDANTLKSLTLTD